MQPTYIVYSVRNYKAGSEEKSSWTRLGAAFQHKDGEGFDLILEALPIDGRLTLRKPKPKEQDAPDSSPSGQPIGKYENLP